MTHRRSLYRRFFLLCNYPLTHFTVPWILLCPRDNTLASFRDGIFLCQRLPINPGCTNSREGTRVTNAPGRLSDLACRYEIFVKRKLREWQFVNACKMADENCRITKLSRRYLPSIACRNIEFSAINFNFLFRYVYLISDRFDNVQWKESMLR